MASIHQSKRPYAGTHSHSNGQASITSYFTPQINPSFSSNGSLSSDPRPLHSREAISTPQLPATVQSNLLSVGMRVRKSVPEGYKTGNGYSGFTLFSDTVNYNPASKVSQQETRNAYSGIGYTGRKELTPFCGLMKVGGLGVQESSVPDEDDFPFLSSQGSTISTLSVGTMDGEMVLLGNSHKRRFDEEVEAESEASIWRDVTSAWEDELSPKTKPLSLPGVALGDRTLAMPRSRRRNGGLVVERKALGKALGQENEDVDVGMDFGEAEFLDYGVLEVEMCDV